MSVTLGSERGKYMQDEVDEVASDGTGDRLGLKDVLATRSNLDIKGHTQGQRNTGAQGKEESLESHQGD